MYMVVSRGKTEIITKENALVGWYYSKRCCLCQYLGVNKHAIATRLPMQVVLIDGYRTVQNDCGGVPDTPS